MTQGDGDAPRLVVCVLKEAYTNYNASYNIVWLLFSSFRSNSWLTKTGVLRQYGGSSWMTRTYTINIEPHSARPPHLYKTFRKNGVTCRRESTWKKQLVKVRVWELLGPRSTGRWPELLLRFMPRLSWYWLPPRRLEIVTCNVLGRGRGGWRVREKKEAENKGRIWWEGVNGKLLLREGREQESFLKLYTYTQYSEQRRPCGRSHGASELLVVGEILPKKLSWLRSSNPINTSVGKCI